MAKFRRVIYDRYPIFDGALSEKMIAASDHILSRDSSINHQNTHYIDIPLSEQVADESMNMR